MSIPHINDIRRANEADRCVREYTFQTLKIQELEYMTSRLKREFTETFLLSDSRKAFIEQQLLNLSAQLKWHKKRARHWARCANLNSPIGHPAIIL